MFTWGAFLPFWCLSYSASVYQVLCENCSMCTCISDAFVGREKNMSSYFSTVLTPQPFYFKSRIYKLCWKTVLHTWLLVKWGLCSSLFFLIAYKTFIFVLKILQFHYNEVEFLFFNFCLICSAFLCFLTLRIIFQQFWEILSQYHIHYPFNYILFLFLTDIAMLVSVVLVSSVAQLCPTLCDPMNLSAPGLPVHHQLPEFTQTHIHRVGDAIQPSHLLSSPLLLPSIPPSIRVFSTESTLLMRWPKYWSFSFSISPSNEHPGLIL